MTSNIPVLLVHETDESHGGIPLDAHRAECVAIADSKLYGGADFDQVWGSEVWDRGRVCGLLAVCVCLPFA